MLLQTRLPPLNKRWGMCMRILGEAGDFLRGLKRTLQKVWRQRERTRRIGGEIDELVGGLNGNSVGRRVIQMALWWAIDIGKG